DKGRQMSIHTYTRNRRWLDERADAYPHTCRTSVKYPRPEQVKKLYPSMSFIRAPLFKEAEWRFKTRLELSAFTASFVTEKNRLTETPIARIMRTLRPRHDAE